MLLRLTASGHGVGGFAPRALAQQTVQRDDEHAATACLDQSGAKAEPAERA